jgi:hypothetical protein
MADEGTKAYSSKTAWKSYLAERMMSGINTIGVIIILESTAMTTVFVSPLLGVRLAKVDASEGSLFLNRFRTAPKTEVGKLDDGWFVVSILGKLGVPVMISGGSG